MVLQRLSSRRAVEATSDSRESAWRACWTRRSLADSNQQNLILNFGSFLPIYFSMIQEIDLPDCIATATSRATLLHLLFRETDRAQRMKSPLSLILIALHGIDAITTSSGEDLLGEIFARVSRVLRSYDLFGRLDDGEFFVLLPGCGLSGAVMLAERLMAGVFANPLRIAGTVRLSACFGITSSMGRSPVIVLREATQALREASTSGPGAVVCFSELISRNR